jgi:hypothetical protein
MTVPLMKITGSGLFAIACAVALLWTCLIGEQIMMRQAREERAIVLRGIDAQRSWHQARPVSAPVAKPSRRLRFAAG